jgi:hypothetical protein
MVGGIPKSLVLSRHLVRDLHRELVRVLENFARELRKDDISRHEIEKSKFDQHLNRFVFK